MTYWLHNETRTETNNMRMIERAVRLGSDDCRKKIHKWHRIVQTEPVRVWDFGPRKNVRIKVNGYFEHRAPRDGDWYVEFDDGTFLLMTDWAYGRYLHLLEDMIGKLTK